MLSSLSARSVGHYMRRRFHSHRFLTVPRWIQKKMASARGAARLSAHRTRAPPRAAAYARPSSRIEGPSRVPAVDTRPTARHADPNVRARSSTHRQRHTELVHRGASSRAPGVARTRGRSRRVGAYRASLRERDGWREMAGACLLVVRGFAAGARDSPSMSPPRPRVRRPVPSGEPLTSPPRLLPPAAPFPQPRGAAVLRSCGTSSFGSSPSS